VTQEFDSLNHLSLADFQASIVGKKIVSVEGFAESNKEQLEINLEDGSKIQIYLLSDGSPGWSVVNIKLLPQKNSDEKQGSINESFAMKVLRESRENDITDPI